MEGAVYRAIEGKTPQKSDFEPQKLRMPSSNFGNNECLACGLSVFEDLKEIETRIKRYRSWRGRSASRGVLTLECGDTLSTGSQKHLTWWVAIEDPQDLFEAV